MAFLQIHAICILPLYILHEFYYNALMKYINRAIEPKILEAAKQFPVIAVTGPRQSGKSTMLRHIFPNYQFVTFDDLGVRDRAKKDPALFIDSFKTPVILDEIQYAPEILSYIKMNIDNYRTAVKSEEINGKFILTGSQVFTLMGGLTETLAGRIAVFELLPFSFEETGDKPRDPLDLYRQLLRGFYPAPNTQDIDGGAFYGSYLFTYIERDVRQIKNIKDISQFQDFLKLLAARAGNILNVQEISKELGITRVTAKSWLSILENSRIIYILRPYFRNISKRVVKSPKLYFMDTGLLSYLLGYQTAETLFSGPASGAVFENMIVVDKLKESFNHRTGGELYFYRDGSGLEADLVVNGKTGPQTLVEVKAGKALREESAKRLSKIPLDVKEKIVVSLRENVIALSNDVKQKPWWEFIK